MLTRILACCALLACGDVLARPLVIESHKQLPVQANWVALQGDELLYVHLFADSSSGTTLYTYTAQTRVRNPAGEWVPGQVLDTVVSETYVPQPRAELGGDAAAAYFPGGLRTYRRTAGGWVPDVIALPVTPQGEIFEFDGDSLFVTEQACASGVRELKRNASGAWAPVAWMTASPADASPRST